LLWRSWVYEIVWFAPQLRRNPLGASTGSDATVTLIRLKTVAAVILVSSLALPQSTCAGYRAPDGKFVVTIPSDAPTGSYQPMVQHEYAFDDFQVTEIGSWLKVAVFVWPLPLLAIAARSRSARLRAFICVADPILALGASYIIWFSASVFATPAVGAYVAITALTVYFSASAIDLWRRWRARPASAERRLTSA
jgi:hypothetical protein